MFHVAPVADGTSGGRERRADDVERGRDVLGVDVEVGDRAHRARVERAHDHAAARASCGAAARGRRRPRRSTMLVSTVAGSSVDARRARPGPRPACARSRGPRPAARRGGRARTARPRRRSPPGAARRRASACSATPRRSARASRPGTAPSGAPRPFVKSSHAVSKPARPLGGGHAGRDDRVHQPRAVHVQPQPVGLGATSTTSRSCSSGHTRPPAMFVVCSTDTSRERGE